MVYVCLHVECLQQVAWDRREHIRDTGRALVEEVSKQGECGDVLEDVVLHGQHRENMSWNNIPDSLVSVICSDSRFVKLWFVALIALGRLFACWWKYIMYCMCKCIGYNGPCWLQVKNWLQRRRWTEPQHRVLWRLLSRKLEDLGSAPWNHFFVLSSFRYNNTNVWSN